VSIVSSDTPETTRARPAEIVAGYLAAIAIFVGLIGIVWHPLRLVGPAIIVAMVAAAMGGRFQRLAFAAAMIVTACFFFGLLFAVLASHPLW
jgi:hypothetical protein